MRQQIEKWVSAWRALIADMDRQGAHTWPLIIADPAQPWQVDEAEQRLGISLPLALRRLFLEGTSEVQIYWSLPTRTVEPFSLGGDIGWSLDSLEWPYFGHDDESADERQYLCFHVGGNGDMLLLDLRACADDPPVYAWGHETDEYILLGHSFTAFVERVTELGCIGAEVWNYEPFAGADGLDVHGENAVRWKKWLQTYRELTLETAATDFAQLVEYAALHGADDERVRKAFDQYDAKVVQQAWVAKISQAPNFAAKEPWCQLLVETLGTKAANWVRSLWESAGQEKLVSDVQRAYLSAACLPKEEGLPLVLAELDNEANSETMSGYTAYGRLKHFRAREVIAWMEAYAAYPLEGWDKLFAVSAPEWHDLAHWLAGSEAQRQIALMAWGRMLDKGDVPTGEPDWTKLGSLLDLAAEKAVLRKERERVERIRAAYGEHAR
ncbi:SMI1/KNR4 family protein [Brevibacillus parabrevis]|uniref:SMI1/KNR4 family protein n=1 Tax=Brevibacillus parabrevis TaxID=54914 RepID=UPI002380A01E|nr:SMI1/KNR4 family protein [Brevibacillus parabrevis]MED2253166.1 SMI1/KNR4 family protein [Brevibacillus parabrevis]WDV97190.1 SMI1/KNR4 family protein [Brevibacillus parabrevis]